MKKAGLLVAVLALLTFGLTSCNIPTTKSSAPVTQSGTSIVGSSENADKTYSLNDAATVNGVSITITDVKVEPVKGDRTSSNYVDSNGEYFALGSDIKKASDYQEIVAAIKIDNKSAKAYTFSTVGIKSKLQDDTDLDIYEAHANSDVSDNTDNVQVSSSNSGSITVNFIVSKTVAVQKLNLTYAFLNYNSDWGTDLQKVIASSMTESEYNAKYKPVNLKFSVDISK